MSFNLLKYMQASTKVNKIDIKEGNTALPELNLSPKILQDKLNY